jgi:hypothetical protein
MKREKGKREMNHYANKSALPFPFWPYRLALPQTSTLHGYASSGLLFSGLRSPFFALVPFGAKEYSFVII